MSEICRLCLSEDQELHSIFHSDEIKPQALNLDDLISMCTSVVVSKNDKSSKICTKCLTFINDWFKFRQNCLQTDARLKNVCNHQDLKNNPKRVKRKKSKIDPNVEQKPYVCGECGKTDFVSAETFRRHKLLHSGRYCCKTCGKTFTCHAILRIHQRDKHENDRPFVCDVCGKAFVTELLMKYHQRFHTGEKKYVCDVCGIAVATSSSLSKHKKRHTDEKPHVCDFCGKGFIVRSRLVEHIRMHTGERPYTCDVCGKAFTMNDKLTRHKKTHSGVKPFFCDVCGNTYSTNHSLTVHRKTHKDCI